MGIDPFFPWIPVVTHENVASLEIGSPYSFEKSSVTFHFKFLISKHVLNPKSLKILEYAKYYKIKISAKYNRL